MVTAPGFVLTEEEVGCLDVEGRVLRHREYWAEEFGPRPLLPRLALGRWAGAHTPCTTLAGDCYNRMASSCGLGPMALAMV